MLVSSSKGVVDFLEDVYELFVKCGMEVEIWFGCYDEVRFYCELFFLKIVFVFF